MNYLYKRVVADSDDDEETLLNDALHVKQEPWPDKNSNNDKQSKTEDFLINLEETKEREDPGHLDLNFDFGFTSAADSRPILLWDEVFPPAAATGGDEGASTSFVSRSGSVLAPAGLGSGPTPFLPTADADAATTTAAAAADWDHNDEILERRELLLYALPLTSDGRLVYLPVTPWMALEEKERGGGGALSRAKEALASAKDRAAEVWDGMKEQETGTFKNKIYRLGQRVIQNLSPEERMVKDIPDDVSKVVIYHPSSLPPDEVMEDLRSRASKVATSSALRAAAAGLMLPIAFGIDILIIPGPQVLTYYSLWELYKNSNSAAGTKRLTRYIAQRGDSNHVRVNYAGDDRLDLYLDMARHSGEGVLSEEDVEAMVVALKEPSLLEPLLLLRERHLRGAQRGGGEGYVRLAGRAADDGFGRSGGGARG